jgi:site-specific recombinase XerD
MSAQVATQLHAAPLRSLPSPTWARLDTTAPEMTATMRRYLAQLGESLKPRSIDAAEAVLRQFAGRVTEADASCRSVAAIERSHVEDYLAWLRARPGQQPNSTVLAGTIAHRVGLVAKFFERVIAWGYEDAPPQSPISRRDAPPAPRPPARGKRLSAVPGPMTPAKRRPAAGLKGAAPEVSWEEVAARAPEMAATMRRYLDQLGVSAPPTTVRAAEGILRLFAGHVSDADPTCRSLAVIERRHIEGYKLWLAARPGAKPGKKLSPVSIRHCLGTLRTFFERVIEWGYPDAPPRVPVYAGDLPRPDEPLPRFLDDPTAAKFMATLAVDPNPRRRLMIELLARTGMRVGELSALEDDAMVHIRDTFWLRIPVGKLHNDRYVPLHPLLVELIDEIGRAHV